MSLRVTGPETWGHTGLAGSWKEGLYWEGGMTRGHCCSLGGSAAWLALGSLWGCHAKLQGALGSPPAVVSHSKKHLSGVNEPSRRHGFGQLSYYLDTRRKALWKTPMHLIKKTNPNFLSLFSKKYVYLKENKINENSNCQPKHSSSSAALDTDYIPFICLVYMTVYIGKGRMHKKLFNQSLLILLTTTKTQVSWWEKILLDEKMTFIWIHSHQNVMWLIFSGIVFSYEQVLY